MKQELKLEFFLAQARECIETIELPEDDSIGAILQIAAFITEATVNAIGNGMDHAGQV